MIFTLTFCLTGCSDNENSSSTINGIDSAIIDTWIGSTKDSDANITDYVYKFESDGYYYMFVNEKQVSYGKYSTDDGVIKIVNPQDELESDTAEYRIDGDKLTLKLNGQEFNLKRTDKEYIGLKIDTLTVSSKTNISEETTSSSEKNTENK